jgi:hypothetical protein
MLIINSEASVKASVEMLGDVHNGNKWVLDSYFNLKWDCKNNTLSHCGIGGAGSFESILKSPLFDGNHIKNYSEEVDMFLKRGYSLILPISTQKMGIPGKNFYHNIFVVSEYDDRNIYVYDFWAPEFKWKKKIWEKEKIIHAIHEIEERKQYAIALKPNDSSDIMPSSLSIKDYTRAYENAASNIGINVYERMIGWIQNMESVFFLDHVIFVTVEEHFCIWNSITEADTQINSLVQEALMKAKALRNLSMKYWYSKKVNSEWKEELVKRVNEIRLCEQNITGMVENTDMSVI